MPLALLVLYAIYILMIRLCFLMFSVESDGVASSEASASRIDILDGVRNFRPRQVKILKHSLLRFGEGGENGGGRVCLALKCIVCEWLWSYIGYCLPTTEKSYRFFMF